MTDDRVTLEQIDKALADFNATVDKEDVLGGTVYAVVCAGLLERLRDQLGSKELLLVPRKYAERALAVSMVAGAVDDEERSLTFTREARRLLGLDPTEK